MPEAEQFRRINILGVGLSAINLDLALAAIDSALAQKSKGYVCVTGVHGVMEAQQDEKLRGHPESILPQHAGRHADGVARPLERRAGNGPGLRA